MYPYRIFVSYAHVDAKLARELVAHLKRLGAFVMWDRSTGPSWPFVEEIKTRIECSHLFIPLITPQSVARPWVQQETGYALGKRVPVLPVAVVGTLPEAMIRGLHSVEVKAQLVGLRGKLTAACIRGAVLNPDFESSPPMVAAHHPERRTEIIVEFVREAQRLRKRRACQPLRESASFSTFSIPNAPPGRPVWDCGGEFESRHYCGLLWQQRKKLGSYASKWGCRLLLHPSVKLKALTAEQRRARLRILVRFLRRIDGRNVRVAIAARKTSRNLLIYDDWFSAESMAPRSDAGYFQTNFTWHAPHVLWQIRRFEDMFRRYRPLDPRSAADRIERFM